MINQILMQMVKFLIQNIMNVDLGVNAGLKENFAAQSKLISESLLRQKLKF
ncbi:hypothetical protein D3C87_2027570 [compost metagenome]